MDGVLWWGLGEYPRLPRPGPTFGIFRLDALRSRRRRTATGTAIRSIITISQSGGLPGFAELGMLFHFHGEHLPAWIFPALLNVPYNIPTWSFLIQRKATQVLILMGGSYIQD